jgi:hypothetical protein
MNDRLGSNGQKHPAQRPANAFLSFAMSNFTCLRISAVTRPGFILSGSLIISTSTVGTLCHLTPHLSTIQPQAWGFPQCAAIIREMQGFRWPAK